jgi:hypothetical protein
MSAYSIVNLKKEVEDSLGERAPGIASRPASAVFGSGVVGARVVSCRLGDVQETCAPAASAQQKIDQLEALRQNERVVAELVQLGAFAHRGFAGSSLPEDRPAQPRAAPGPSLFVSSVG